MGEPHLGREVQDALAGAGAAGLVGEVRDVDPALPQVLAAQRDGLMAFQAGEAATLLGGCRVNQTAGSVGGIGDGA